jgi:hypothetical protein
MHENINSTTPRPVLESSIAYLEGRAGTPPLQFVGAIRTARTARRRCVDDVIGNEAARSGAMSCINIGLLQYHAARSGAMSCTTAREEPRSRDGAVYNHWVQQTPMEFFKTFFR